MSLWLIVGAVCIVLVMIGVPILFKSIKIEDDKLYFKESSILELVEKDGKYSIKAGGLLLAEEDEIDLINIKEIFNEDTINKMVPYIESALVVALIYIATLYMVLYYLGKLFDNINKEETPFIEENVKLLMKVCYALLAYIVLPYLVGAFVDMIIDVDLGISWNLFHILLLFIIIVFANIFDYGCFLENNQKK